MRRSAERSRRFAVDGPNAVLATLHDPSVPDILLAPYLPISEALSVGPWDLVPFRRLGDSGAVPDALQGPVSRLIEAYRLPSSGGSVLGAVAFPHGTNVGAAFDRSSMSRLSHALLAGVVSNNPRMAVAEDDQSPNAGHGMATSENALLYGHPVTDGNSYVTQVGMLVRVLAMSHAPQTEPLPKVAAPVELPKVMFGGFDDELAGATYTALDINDASARRLRRALDWYRIVLCNAEAVTIDVRVGAARCALEVLTDAGDETRRLVRAFGRLVQSRDEVSATYDDVFWAKGPVQLTPPEWWITRLCELRNATVHGDDVPEELWTHAGHHQLNHIHDQLIVALRTAVADRVDDPLLRLTLSDRIFPRIRVQEREAATQDMPDPSV